MEISPKKNALGKKKLKSGDLLLFDGEGGPSKLVKFFTISCWSHVALVYECPKTKELYAWEIGGLPRGSGPVINRKRSGRNAAHLAPLKNRLETYRGVVYVRRLFGEIDQKVYDKWVAANLGVEYSWDLIISWNQKYNGSLIPLSFMEDHKDGKSGWVCSQMAALTYQHLGVMTILQPSHTIVPSDFAGEMELNQGYFLHDLELISYNLPLDEIF